MNFLMVSFCKSVKVHVVQLGVEAAKHRLEVEPIGESISSPYRKPPSLQGIYARFAMAEMHANH